MKCCCCGSDNVISTDSSVTCLNCQVECNCLGCGHSFNKEDFLITFPEQNTGYCESCYMRVLNGGG